MPGWSDITATYAGAAPDGSDITVTAHMPPAAGDTFQLWNWLIQFWRAVGEREAVARGNYAFNQVRWPAANIWDAGGAAITSATDNGDGTVTFAMTVNPTTWTVDCFSNPPFRWVGYSCHLEDGTPVCVPVDYKLVIDPVGALVDPSKVVQMFITSMTYTAGATTGTLTGSIGPINDMITAGIIPNLAYLVGCPWCIIDANGVYSSDRIPPKPLARPKYADTATIGTTAVYPVGSDPTEHTYSVLYDENANWQTDQWVGDDLLFYDVRLKRVSVIHNDGQRIYFTAGTYDAVSTAYCIAKAGAVTYPGAPTASLLQWYFGLGEAYFSHSITDSPDLGGAILALGSKYLTVDGEEPCDHEEPFTAFDTPDAYIDFNNECYCTQVGQFFSPGYWKSFHALQVELFSLCGLYVPKKDYDGISAITPFSPATLPGIPSFSSTVAIVSGNMTFDVTGYDGVPLWYAIQNTDGSIYNASTVTPASGVASLGIADTTPTMAGASVVYTPGNTRKYKRRVKYFYPTPANFIPDTSETGGLINPPAPTLNTTPGPGYGTYSCTGVGTFIFRPASTNYALFDDTGKLVDNAGPAFVDGDLVCHEGDNQGASPIIPLTPFSGSPIPPLMPFYDRMFRGTYDKPLQTQKLSSMSGAIVASTNYSITTTQHFWDDGVNPGLMRTDTGTATSGNATSLTDASRNTADNTLPWGCWYSTDRFATGYAPYVGGWWNLECDQVQTGTDLAIDASNDKQVTSGSYTFSPNDVGATLVIPPAGSWTGGSYTIVSVNAGAAILNTSPGPVSTAGGHWTLTTTYKLPITSFTDHHGTGGVTWGFAAVDGFTVTTGMVRRLKETYCPGKWIGRELVLTAIDGTQTILPIGGNDDPTIFFPAQAEAIPLTSTWEIREKSFGSTWKYVAATGKFVVPPDPVTGILPTDQTEQPYQFKIEPTYVTDYGPMRCGDLPGAWIFQELYQEINALLVLKKSVTFTANAVPGTPEVNNYYLDSGGPFIGWSNPPDGYTGPYTSAADAGGAYVAALNAAALDANDPVDGPLTTENGMPLKQCNYNSNYTWNAPPSPTPVISGGWVDGGPSEDNQTGYAHVTVPTVFPSSVTFYSIADQGDTLNTVTPASSPDVTTYALDVFDAQGDPVLCQQWKSWSTVSPGTDGKATSTRLGNPDAVDMTQTVQWPPNNSYVAGYDDDFATSLTVTNGYRVTDACALADYSSGFSFVPPS